MLFPSIEEVQKLSAQYSIVPVSFTFAADHCSPLAMYMALADGQRHAFLLEGDFAGDGRFTVAGAEPALAMRFSENRVNLQNDDTWSEIPGITATDFLRDYLAANTAPALHPFFTGGLVGRFPDAQWDHGLLFHYRELAVYDHAEETISIVLHLQSNTDLGAQYQAAEIRAAELASRIDHFHSRPQFWDDKPPVLAEFPVTETNFAQVTAEIDNAPDSFEVFRRLRRMEPASGLLYMKYDQGAFLGCFPVQATAAPVLTAGTAACCGTRDIRPVACAAAYERDRAVLTIGGSTVEEAAAHSALLLRALNAARR